MTGKIEIRKEITFQHREIPQLHTGKNNSKERERFLKGQMTHTDCDISLLFLFTFLSSFPSTHGPSEIQSKRERVTSRSGNIRFVTKTNIGELPVQMSSLSRGGRKSNLMHDKRDDCMFVYMSAGLYLLN